MNFVAGVIFIVAALLTMRKEPIDARGRKRASNRAFCRCSKRHTNSYGDEHREDEDNVDDSHVHSYEGDRISSCAPTSPTKGGVLSSEFSEPLLMTGDNGNGDGLLAPNTASSTSKRKSSSFRRVVSSTGPYRRTSSVRDLHQTFVDNDGDVGNKNSRGGGRGGKLKRSIFTDYNDFFKYSLRLSQSQISIFSVDHKRCNAEDLLIPTPEFAANDMVYLFLSHTPSSLTKLCLSIIIDFCSCAFSFTLFGLMCNSVQ